MDGWIKKHQHGVIIIVAYGCNFNNCSYIVAIELHELHTYIVPHMVSCVHYNSCATCPITFMLQKYVKLQ